MVNAILNRYPISKGRSSSDRIDTEEDTGPDNLRLGAIYFKSHAPYQFSQLLRAHKGFFFIVWHVCHPSIPLQLWKTVKP